MKTNIFKYPLKARDIQEVIMPKGSKILSTAEQNEEICIWALCPETKETEVREIAVLPTGATQFPDGLGEKITTENYIGSAFFRTEGLVFHVFDVTKKKS